MLTWKKPIVTVLASAGVLVSSALPQLALGQSTSHSRATQQGTSEFVQDSVPFSTPYQQEVRSDEPMTELKDDSDPPLAKQIISLPPTKVSLNSESRTINNFPVNQQVLKSNGFVASLPSTSPESKSGLPTVIVRPPANDSVAMNDLTVNVEKIAGSNDHEFAVRLTVPDSVKIIEVTPVHDPDSPRNFNIRLEQQSIQQADQIRDGAVASTYSMPIASPVRSASSLNAIEYSTSSKRPEPTALPHMIPVKQQSPVRNGFQRNPYFEPDDANQPSEKQPIAIVPKSTGPPEVLEAMQPPTVSSIDNTEAKQASHSTTSINSLSPGQFDGSASRMSYVASNESDSTIHSAMFGPNRMGLGDTGDFIISVFNPTAATINDITVRLNVPSGFEVVVLDRVAEVDENAGSLTWQIPDMTPDQEHLIRYRVMSLVEGGQLQQVQVRSRNSDLRASDFNTVVDIEFASPEAPLLPFESN